MWILWVVSNHDFFFIYLPPYKSRWGSKNLRPVFQLDFEIFRTIASFIKISSGHSLMIKLIFIKFFRIIWEIGGQMSWDQHLAESLLRIPLYENANPWKFVSTNLNKFKVIFHCYKFVVELELINIWWRNIKSVKTFWLFWL